MVAQGLLKLLQNLYLVDVFEFVYVVENAFDSVGASVNDLSEVHVNEKGADNVAVKAVGVTSMTWDGICEIFNFKSSLQT